MVPGHSKCLINGHQEERERARGCPGVRDPHRARRPAWEPPRAGRHLGTWAPLCCDFEKGKRAGVWQRGCGRSGESHSRSLGAAVPPHELGCQEWRSKRHPWVGVGGRQPGCGVEKPSGQQRGRQEVLVTGWPPAPLNPCTSAPRRPRSHCQGLSLSQPRPTRP